MKFRKILFLILIAAVLCGLTPYEEQKLPKVRVLYVYRENIMQLWDFLLGKSKDNYEVIDMRVGIRYVSTELSDRIKAWVSAGGGIVVYAGANDESDSAQIFFSDKDITYTDLNRWRAVRFLSSGINHPVLKKVKIVRLYVRRIPNVKNKLGKIPLLNTPDGRMVAFAFNFGRGRGIYLPCNVLLPEFPEDEYDNKRFFINIYQWLAKRNVPD